MDYTPERAWKGCIQRRQGNRRPQPSHTPRHTPPSPPPTHCCPLTYAHHPPYRKPLTHKKLKNIAANFSTLSTAIHKHHIFFFFLYNKQQEECNDIIFFAVESVETAVEMAESAAESPPHYVRAAANTAKLAILAFAQRQGKARKRGRKADKKNYFAKKHDKKAE